MCDFHHPTSFTYEAPVGAPRTIAPKALIIAPA